VERSESLVGLEGGIWLVGWKVILHGGTWRLHGGTDGLNDC